MSIIHRIALCVVVAIVAVDMLGCGSKSGMQQPTPVLTSITLSPTSVVGGTSVTGTATLSVAAQSGGATVSLSSSNTGAATVPANVTVPAGATSMTFSVTTSAVTSSASVTITGNFGATQTATLTVNPPALSASFVVTAPNQPNNRCALVDANSFDCTFNGSASVGATSYQWTYRVGPNELNNGPNSSAQLGPVPINCGLFTGQTGGGPNTNLQMMVTLTVRNASGASAQSMNNSVTVVPKAATCGF